MGTTNKTNTKLKELKMMLEEMNRSQMEIAILENDIPCEIDEVIEMEDEKVRELIQNWIEEKPDFIL